MPEINRMTICMKCSTTVSGKSDGGALWCPGCGCSIPVEDLPTPTNNQTGASGGPWEIQQCYPIGDFRLIQDGVPIASCMTEARANQIADLGAENAALKAAVAEMRARLTSQSGDSDMYVRCMIIQHLQEFNVLFDPLTGAKEETK